MPNLVDEDVPQRVDAYSGYNNTAQQQTPAESIDIPFEDEVQLEADTGSRFGELKFGAGYNLEREDYGKGQRKKR